VLKDFQTVSKGKFSELRPKGVLRSSFWVLTEDFRQGHNYGAQAEPTPYGPKPTLFGPFSSATGQKALP
jgi:hypothetical protein